MKRRYTGNVLLNFTSIIRCFDALFVVVNWVLMSIQLCNESVMIDTVNIKLS